MRFPRLKILKAKRRHMLLLEVLIAMALVALCILPIIAPQLAIVKEQKSFIHHMDLDHAVHLLYVDVLEKLHMNKIDWHQIESKTPHPIPDDMLPRGVVGTYFFEIIDHKYDTAKEWNVYQLRITFAFTQKNEGRNNKPQRQSHSFPYGVTILRHIAANHDPSQDTESEEKKPPKPKASSSGKSKKNLERSVNED